MTEDLQRILDDIAANEASARAVIQGLGQAQLNWQAEPGKTWSILQCIEHLALADGHYTGAMREALKRSFPARTGPIRPSALGGVFLKRLEPPVTQAVRAPKVIVPRANKTAAEVMAAFLVAHEQIRAVIRDGAALDLNAIRFRNPLLPILRVRVGTGLLIMAAHERRHLWQANRVRQALAASGQTTT
jgi:hypothetical protein